MAITVPLFDLSMREIGLPLSLFKLLPERILSFLQIQPFKNAPSVTLSKVEILLDNTTIAVRKWSSLYSLSTALPVKLIKGPPETEAFA